MFSAGGAHTWARDTGPLAAQGARRGPARGDTQEAFPTGGFPGCTVGITVSTQRTGAVLTSLMHRLWKICFQKHDVGLLAGCVYPQREEPVRSKNGTGWPGQLCSELSSSADPFLGTSCLPWRLLAGVPGTDWQRPHTSSEVQVRRGVHAADSAESIDLSPIG